MPETQLSVRRLACLKSGEKMYHILLKTPFGFVLELKNEECYYSEEKYELYLNDVLYGTYRENLITVYGLEPERRYRIKISGPSSCIAFELETEKISFLLDVREYNAKADGKTDNTAAVNTAIYMAPEGSVVYLPKGDYLVNQIYLKSGVDLYLEKGCCIRQNIYRSELGIIKGYQKDYHHTKAVVNSSWEGNPLDTYCSIFLGKDVSNIHIYGEGMIDGSGEQGRWWENVKQKNIAFRPKNIFLNHCQHITISGIKSRNSACWNIHPFYSDHIKIYGVQIESRRDSPNTDGINPESCENVEIAGCLFDVGDDCIAIKSGKYFMSRKYYKPSKRIEIRNCYMGSGHGGVAIGSEISSGVDQIYITQCFMEGTERGIRVKTRRGRGNLSVVSNLKAENIRMKDVTHCIGVNMFYNCDPDGSSEYVRSKELLIKGDETPEIKNIAIYQLKATGVKGCCLFLYGLPESKIMDVTLADSSVEFSTQRISEAPELLDDFTAIEGLGFFIKNASNVRFLNNEFTGVYVSAGEEASLYKGANSERRDT